MTFHVSYCLSFSLSHYIYLSLSLSLTHTQIHLCIVKIIVCTQTNKWIDRQIRLGVNNIANFTSSVHWYNLMTFLVAMSFGHCYKTFFFVTHALTK